MIDHRDHGSRVRPILRARHVRRRAQSPGRVRQAPADPLLHVLIPVRLYVDATDGLGIYRGELAASLPFPGRSRRDERRI